MPGGFTSPIRTTHHSVSTSSPIPLTLPSVPIWKTPVYNSPVLNWKRGMYALSTAIFTVSH